MAEFTPLGQSKSRNVLKAILLASGLVAVTAAYKLLNRPHPIDEGLTDAVINAVIEIESHGNPNASRYERHINDTSYGLMQLLTSTARDIEKKHQELPRLGKTPSEIKASLLNPEINRAYGTALLSDLYDTYGNLDLAVAAYNAGFLTPRNARVQEQLNDLLGTSLHTDGIFGPQSRKALTTFQQKYGSAQELAADGKYGPQTEQLLQQEWQRKFPSVQNPKGVVPKNNITPYHLQKFRRALSQ